MGFFDELVDRAKESPKIVALPELPIEAERVGEDGPMARAAKRAEDDGIARIVPVSREMIEESGKLDEFVERYREVRGLVKSRRPMVRRLVSKPNVFAVGLVRLGYAHGMVSGKYTQSYNVMAAVNALMEPEEGKIPSTLFFCEPPEDYPVFDLLAVADVVVNPYPSADEIASIAETSCETFQALTGHEPRAAILSYSTGTSGRGELVDRIHAAMEAYERRGRDWFVWGPCQFDAAINTAVAKNKRGCPFTDEPANIIVGPTLDVANNMYKAVQWLIPGCRTMLCSQGVALPVDDLSRGDDEQAIYNVIAANVVKAQTAEEQGKYPGEIDEFFLDV
ncbi:MAG: phosphate acyltransferase [Planctomycetota bacterium]